LCAFPLQLSANGTPEKRLDEEAAEREARRKEREESHLYLSVRVVTDDTYRAYGGTDLTVFDAKHDVDPAAARSYRLLRKSTVKELAARVGQDTGCDPSRIRLWCMVNRQNKTVRPDTPILDADSTLEETHLKMSGNKQQELRLWAEIAEEVTPQGEAIWPTYQNVQNGTTGPPKTDLIVLFLKYFNVEEQSLAGVGHIYISKEKKVEELVPAILKKMQWPEKLPNGERLQLKLYEVCFGSQLSKICLTPV
jgi:ubiquitin carboxyl-terminal hydrolase 7